MNINLQAASSIVAAQKPASIGNRDASDTARIHPADGPQKQADSSTAPGDSHPIVVENAQVNLRFYIDKATGAKVIQVIDAQSGELVRQIPPEELLNITKALRELKGLLVSKEL